ncbi:uracil-DNA glycosylase family protein [Arcobacteraceae bacterium]|jgi:DNA polymerase|nr:uracil-DNA glycosylase family protein [Arcobacteraceae bacterium]
MNITEKVKIELLQILKMKKIFGLEYMNQLDFQNYTSMESNLPSSLEVLNEYVSNCSLCELSKVKTSTSFVKGNMNSKILIVTLNDTLDKEKEFTYVENTFQEVLKLSINDIYMTNILKCNTDKYKENFDTEVSKCIHYLEQQISLIRPEIIITFGTSFKYMMENKDVLTDISGNLYNYRGIKLIPLLGIDFISKNPSYKKRMFNDIIKIKNIMDEK